MQEGIVIVGEVHTNLPSTAGLSGFHGEPYLFVGNAHVYGDWRKCKLDKTTLVSGLKVRAVVVPHPRYNKAYQAVEDKNGVPLIRRLTDNELTVLSDILLEHNPAMCEAMGRLAGESALAWL